MIVIGDFDITVLARTLCVDRFDVGHQRADWTGERQRSIDHMRRQVTHGAIRLPENAPCCRLRRIGEKVLGVLAAKIGDVTDFTRLDHLPCQLRSRRADVVETAHIDRAARFCRSNHLPGFMQSQPHRLLTEHRLPSFKGSQRDVQMGMLGGCDDDGLNGRIIDQDAPIRRRPVETEFRGLAGGSLLRSRADHFAMRPELCAENRTHRVHRHGVRLAHVAAADNTDANAPHRSLPGLILQPVAKFINSIYALASRTAPQKTIQRPPVEIQ